MSYTWQLNNAYRKVYDYTKLVENATGSRKEARLEFLKDAKRSFRQLRDAVEMAQSEAQWRLPFGYSDDSYYDSRAMFYEEPYVVQNVDEYKESHWWHWYNPYDDGRDCTGVWFTHYIQVFPLPKAGKTIVYHVQGCDV